MSRMVQEALLVLKTQVAGGEALNQLQRQLTGVEGATRKARAAFSGVVNSASWQGAAVAAAGIGVALGTSVQAAVGFESAMADVRKVVPGLEDAAGLREMEQAIIDLSREIPISAEGFAQIIAAAGQAGIAKDELVGFAESAAQMAVAFDISADEAGNAMAKLRTSMGLSQPEVEGLADMMNHLSNNMASSAPEVTDFMLRVGAFGQQVAMTEAQTAGLGSAMIAAGAAPEVAATSFRNLIKEMASGENATKKQRAAWKSLGFTANEIAQRMQVDAVGTIREVFQRLAQIPAEARIPTIETLFGNEARALAPVIKNLDLFEKAMGLAGDTTGATGSMLREFEARSGTTANQLELFRNNLQALQIVVGQALLPALNQLAAILLPILSTVADAAQKFPVLTTAVVGLAAAFAALVAALPFVASLMSIISSLGGAGPILAGVAGAFAGLGAAVTGFGATLAGWLGVVGPTLAAIGAAFKTLLAVVAGVLTGPVGWAALIAAAIAALVMFREPIGQFVAWSQAQFRGWAQSLWDLHAPIREFWLGLWNSARELAMAFFDWIGSAVSTYLLKPWQTVGGLLIDAISGLWEKLKAPTMAFFDWWGDTLYKLFVEPWVVGAARVYETVRGLWPRLQQSAASFWGWITGQVQRFVVEPFIRARDTITAAWGGFSTAIAAGLTGVAQAFQNAVVRPIQDAWNGVLSWLSGTSQRMAQAVSGAFQAIASGVVGAFQSTVQGVVGLINRVIGLINQAIGALNRLRQAGGMSALQQVGQVSVPGFATGSYVQRPTLAYVGEGGEPEYVVPASKMGAASMAFLSGRRGAAVLAGGQAGPSGGGAVNITIRTGPVMQAQGQQWVTVEDLQAAGEQIAAQIYAGLRAPAGRRALGVA